MSIIGFIVMGDRTSHGGTVVSGDMTFTIDGQPIARIGDKVFCPRCKKTTVIVTSRFPTVSAFGQNVAYDQDSTTCGALLNSRHNGHAGWEAEGSDAASGSSSAAGASAGVVAGVAEYLPKEALRFQEHFIMHDEAGTLMANVPYSARTGEGRIIEGETDAEGRTAIIWTDSPEAVEIKVGPRATDEIDPYHYDEQDYGDL